MTILKTLREQSGVSQDFFAKELGITRQTLAKYEGSIEDAPMPILKKISRKFNLSIDNIVANKIPKEPTYNIIPSKKEKDTKQDMRIDVPEKNIDKFKEVLLYILEKVGAKHNVSQTVIYKLLYFIDFDFYEIYEEQLIGATYIKNHFGPTPIEFAKIIKQMQKDGELEEIKTKYFQYNQTKYIPGRQADISILSAQEIKHIDTILERHSDKSAKDLSDYSHKDVPWLAADDNDVISYESVFYRTPETSVRKY